MIMAKPLAACDPSTDDRVHDSFLPLQSIVERHTNIVFRNLPSVDREEAVAEAVAAAFQSFVSLIRRGKDPHQFPTMLATRAAQHVLNGRRVGSRCRRGDVFARASRRSLDCRLRSLPHRDDPAWADALVDNRRTPVPDQVSFRCDFPCWLQTLTPRDRKIANQMALGHTTKWMAQRFGLTPARIAQLRRELHALWQGFHGEREVLAG